MDFTFTEEQRMIADSAKEVAKDFPPEYWREKDTKEEHADEFYKAVARAGFTGTLIPQEFGGAGEGMTEMCIAIEEMAANGCGMAAVWYLVVSEVVPGLIMVRSGTEEQKKKYLPRIVAGDEFCFALTEPDAGSNSLNTKTRATKVDNGWVINGGKTWITEADKAIGMLIVTRTTPKEKAPKKTFGISLFLTDLPNPAITISPLPKHGIRYSKSFDVGIDDLKLSEDALVPPQDEGWYSLLYGLDPERMVFTAAAIGIARIAISKAVEYTKGRKVFGDEPIGKYQGLQFNLAEAYIGIEAAKLLNFKSTILYDNGASFREFGPISNMAKYVATDSGIKAVERAMTCFGGLGYAVDTDVERWWREINLLRLAPFTQQLGLAYVGEHVLGMPRSYAST